MRLGLLIIVFLVSSAMAADVVVLRDGQGELTGTIQASDDSALRIETLDGKRRQVAWDVIRAVRFDSAVATPGSMTERMKRAEDIWRARSRLQRGDAALAEPIFERLFVASPERRGETDLIIAEGLLRSRLNRGAILEAYLPALETARLRRLGIKSDRYDDLVPVYDEATSLCVFLAPPWTDQVSTTRLIQQLEQWKSGGDERLANIAEGYRILAEHAGGTIPDSVETPSSETETGGGDSSLPNVLRLAIESRRASSTARRSAQGDLRHQLSRRDDWQEPLFRYMLGTSLLLEPGEGLRRQGLVELAWLPARHGRSHPYLAGVALAIMARELAAQGDLKAAMRLEAELKRTYPNHPVNRTSDPLGAVTAKEADAR